MDANRDPRWWREVAERNSAVEMNCLRWTGAASEIHSLNNP